MSDKSNDLVALEWLLTPLNEQMGEIHHAWQEAGIETDFLAMSQRFHEISNVLTLANLTAFAKLAHLLKETCVYLGNKQVELTLAPKVFYASKLLQYEINRFVLTGSAEHGLTDLRIYYLQDLLKAANDAFELVLAEEGERISVSEKFTSGEVEFSFLDANGYQALESEWRLKTQKLLESNINDKEALDSLSKVSSQLQAATHEKSLAGLWQMTAVWLSSLAKNDKPVPHQYAHLLAELDKAIKIVQSQEAPSESETLWLENVLVDVYVQLCELGQTSDEAYELLAALSMSASSDEQFFPHILSVIEGLLYGMAKGEVSVAVLTEVKEQLGHRGWSFYESYAEQIIADIQSTEGDPDLFAQMQWQITTQLQDLYAAILNTHESIVAKVGDGVSAKSALGEEEMFKALRRVRILVEELKYAFSDYLHNKDSETLPDAEVFGELNQIFDDMGMSNVGAVSDQLAKLFTRIKAETPSQISWSFAYAAADGLSLLELFLDALAKQVFDHALLERAKARIEEAHSLMGTDGEAVAFEKKHSDSVLYDDSGEVTPAQFLEAATEDSAKAASEETDDEVWFDDDDVDLRDSTPALSDDVSSAKVDDVEAEMTLETEAEAELLVADSVATGGVMSAAYLLAKDSLKDDDFEFDEDIREIFVEEAEEVLESLADLLPSWQANPSNLNPLKDIRRGFHTLKGSGRMVGANNLGEMAWAVENLLNRVLDGTVPSTPVLVDFVIETTGLIPAMVQDFSDKETPRSDPAIVVLKANNLLAGKPISDGLSVSEAPAVVQKADVEEAEVEVAVTTNELPEVLLPFMASAAVLPELAVDEIDEDIKEIYIEEAAEVLEEITPLFAKWRHHTSDKSVLTDIRRGFHTLKGSGRMVGAVELGELAWSVENMLNRVLDDTVQVNDGMLALLEDVLGSFGGLVKLFEENSNDYPEVMTLWIATAHAYSKGHGDEFDYRALQSGATPAVAEEEVPNVEALQVMQEVELIVSQAQITIPDDDEEEILCLIFVEEARSLLSSVHEFVNNNANEVSVAVDDDVVRVFHTLRGASGLAPMLAVSQMGAVVEEGLQHLQRHDLMMTPKHLEALGRSVSLIEAHLDAYEKALLGESVDAQNATQEHADIEALMASDTPAAEVMDVASLIEGIDTLLDAELELEAALSNDKDQVKAYANTVLSEIEVLENRTLSSSKFQKLLFSLTAAYQVLEHHPEQASDDDFVNALIAAQVELTGLFDSLAGSMSLKLSDTVVSTLDRKVSDIQGYYSAIDKHELVMGEETANAAEVVYQEVDTDPELLEIFLEEASELDAAITETFNEWKEDTSNTEALKALQRHLHTIKGGARLAGISSIGDLTHEAETVYERMVDGRLTPTEGWVTAMQSVQDTLSLQIDEVKQNKRTFFATEAVSKLQTFLETGEPAAIAMPVLNANAAPAAEVVEAETETVTSDFDRRQLRSWHGTLPDADILAVFLEEAEDLVESSSEDFQVFRSNTGDLATLQSLQRKLHTIKGGARMVTANGLADLAHHMETVYEDLGSRRRPATRMIIQLLLSCHDWMTSAMTLLKATLNPSVPTLLIEALEKFSRRPDSLSEVPVVSLAEELDAILAHEAYERQRRGGRDISRMPPASGLFEQSEDTAASNEMIRISANLMERMINLSGEAAINRARIDMSMSSLTASIEEMGVTVQRLADQLRRMDIELEAQILAQIDDKALFEHEGFDPLEMDQYSLLNQLSKSLSESASDLLDLKATLLEKTRDGENLLLQLSRTQAELQDGLMYSRMVPFSRLTPRLQRIVRQVSSELGKSVELNVVNADDEMDRTILERITSPLEHMLRNAIDHGIEMPEERIAMGKSKTGHITLEVVREGSEILVHLTDDGAGINVEAVRKKAISQGLINENDTSLSDLDIMQYIFNAGLSTTSVITQISGRGVGMDVVRSEIRQLGGLVSVDSVRGQGSRFTMRVPLTVAVSDTLVVRAADRQYAIPLVQIERITQVDAKKLLKYYQSTKSTIEIDGEHYRLRYLNEILSGHDFSELLSTRQTFPVILVKNQAGQNLALQVDEIVGSRIEVVVKPLGRQLSHVSGISAATIMGDGSVMFILDLMALLRNARVRVAVAIEDTDKATRRPVVLVVDDSVTVRKVTSRFLERQGFETVVAKDGVDAIEILQELTPDLMLLDIEMPRMDGFEVATQVRRNSRLEDLPIIMITSRTGEKHRERAFEIGVTDYMGKPFQENDLLNRINMHLSR
ncbi:MAG: Hpt domain-containing protein [Moraxella sp.]|nr:Hpt domain-containing protein [Moraxella sp.]